MNKNQILNLVLQTLAGDHGTPVEGIVWYDSTAKAMKFHNGTATQTLGVSGGTGTAAIQFANSSRFLGRVTAGAGGGEELTVAQAKTLLAIAATDVSGFDTQVRTNRLDQMAAPTAAVAFGSQKITGLADGTVATDAATFGQLSAAIQGFDWKVPVRVVSTANVATLSGLLTIDGVTLVAGERVLLAGQTAAAANGIYVAAAGAWARATDADAAAELNNATVFVEAGTAGAGDVYTQTATIATLGTTNQTWVKSAEGNTVYAADGTSLTLTGTTFSINTAWTGQTAITTLGTIGTGTWAATEIGVARGGTGATTAAGARTNLAATGKFAADIPANASPTFTHNLNTRDVVVSVRSNTTPWAEVECDVEMTDANTVTLRFASAPTANAYRVIIIG
jgi:hypothetical protein